MRSETDAVEVVLGERAGGDTEIGSEVDRPYSYPGRRAELQDARRINRVRRWIAEG